MTQDSSIAIIPLLNWDFLHIGALAWDDAGNPIPCETAAGIELIVTPAAKSEPILQADQPWEKHLGWTQVLYDQGRYRMWYGVYLNGKQGTEEFYCYAESDDGIKWTKPSLGLVEWQGDSNNNIVLTGCGVTHSYVFIDPTAEPAQRYKLMQFRAWWQGQPGETLDPEEGLRRLNAKNTAPPGTEPLPVSIIGQMFGYYSPDGLRWTQLPEPILDEWHDTHNIAAYDTLRRKYVAYFRGFYGGRRATTMAETDDFAHWPPSQICHTTQPGDGPNASIYSNCYTTYPGRLDVRLMFPAIYRQETDTVDVEMAISLDGRQWNRHVGQRVIAIDDDNAPDSGFIYADPELLRHPDGKFQLIYHGGTRRHNQGYNQTYMDKVQHTSFYAWATWDEDRLVGVKAQAHGHFTLHEQTCGQMLLANYRTEPDGWIKFELIDRLIWPPAQIPPIDGFSFDQCQPLTGDELRGVVSWNHSSDLSKIAGSPVALRVRMYKATLYAVAWVNADSDVAPTEMRFPV